MTRSETLALAGLLLVVAPAAARGNDASFSSATVDGVATMAFSLLRTGAGAGGADLNEAVVGGAVHPGAVSRILWDPKTGIYFGYRVDMTRTRGGFRLGFRPLEHDVVVGKGRSRPEEARVTGPEGAPPRPLAATPRFPSPQTLTEGEILTLELLANPTTGERIYDVIKVSEDPISPAALEAAVARARDGQAAARRAAAHVARGRYWEAAEEYRRALEIQPRDAVLHNKLGICYQQLGNHAMAQSEYNRALEINPSYAEVWNNIGTLEQQRGRLKESVRAYQKAIQQKRELATPWKNLGNAYLALKRPEEAFEAYQEAFRLDPTIVESQGLGIPAAGVDPATQSFYLAKLLAGNGQTDAALAFLRRAREAGFQDFDRVRADPDFEAVVADPRFEALLAQ